MGKHIGTGGRAWGKILGRLAFYTWVRTVMPDYEFKEEKNNKGGYNLAFSFLQKDLLYQPP